MELWELDQAIRAVCPVEGVRSNKTIVFKPEATQEQRDAALALAAAADLTTPTDPDKLATSRFDGMDKTEKAILLLMRNYCNALVAGTQTTKTIAQLKADFITAFKALP
jgi:hypothetical protein